MVGSAAHAAAVEERRKKLQEYLAAKGKLKCPNTKPYLRDQKQCPKPSASRSTTRPKNDPTRWTQSHAAGRPAGNVLQPGSSNVDGTQRPKPAAPKIPGKGPITSHLSSKPDCKLSGNGHVHHQQKTTSCTVHKLTRKSVTSSETQCMRRLTEQNTTGHRIARWMDPVTEPQAENQLLDDLAKETDKENRPLPTTQEPKRKPETGFCNRAKSKARSDNPLKRGLAAKQAVDKGSKDSVLLKDQVNKPFVHRIQGWVPTGKPQQQLPRGTGCERPGDQNLRTVHSHWAPSLARTRESKKQVTKKEDGKVHKVKEEGHNRTKSQEKAVIQQTVERCLPKVCRMGPQVGKFNRWHQGKQDVKVMQPCTKRKPSVMAPPSRTTIRHSHLTGGTSKVHTQGPTKNQYNYSSKREPQTLDSKAKRTVPQNCSLTDLTPKAQPGVSQTKPTTRKGGMQNPALLEAPITQVKPNTQRKRCEEDRRISSSLTDPKSQNSQSLVPERNQARSPARALMSGKKLEEWLASKGKTYKRPPMKFLAQNKNMQKLNLSFWKSIKEEEETKKAEQDLSSKINSTLAECLKLVEEGARSDEILAILSGFPEAERFATFWICKAKLLARQDSSEVVGLYEAAVRCGAEPIQELRDVVLKILKSSKKTTEGVTSETNSTSVKETAKEELSRESYFLTPRVRVQEGDAPQLDKKNKDNHLMPRIKLQVTPLPRTPGMPAIQAVKLVTPVRRSLRIEHARPNYPDRLQEHGTLVASLDQLPMVTEADCFIYCKNEALPEETELQILAAS